MLWPGCYRTHAPKGTFLSSYQGDILMEFRHSQFKPLRAAASWKTIVPVVVSRMSDCRHRVVSWICSSGVLLGLLALLASRVHAAEPQSSPQTNGGQQSLTNNSPLASALDLSGKAVDPLREPAKATVLVFLDPECPISNRYAPLLQRMARQFETRSVRFWLVYPDPDLSFAKILKHLKEYSYTVPALHDPKHVLVRKAKAQVTPEAAVFTSEGKLIYHGRIDDRYVDFGKERAAPTQHDLKDALEACLAGKSPPRETARAIGCYISE